MAGQCVLLTRAVSRWRATWPLYRAEKPAVLELGEQIQVVAPADAALCFWLGLK